MVMPDRLPFTAGRPVTVAPARPVPVHEQRLARSGWIHRTRCHCGDAHSPRVSLSETAATSDSTPGTPFSTCGLATRLHVLPSQWSISVPSSVIVLSLKPTAQASSGEAAATLYLSWAVEARTRGRGDCRLPVGST